MVGFCGSGQRSLYSDSLRAGRSGDRIPVEARFSAPVQTGPGAHTASCAHWVSLPELKRLGRGVDHSHPSGLSWPVLVLNFRFTLRIGLYRPSLCWGNVTVFQNYIPEDYQRKNTNDVLLCAENWWCSCTCRDERKGNDKFRAVP